MKTTMNTKNNTISKAILVILTLVLALATTPASHACTVLDLTGVGSSGLVNGAVFQQFGGQSPAANASSFLRIQNTGVEAGYNTNGVTQFNTIPGAWTHAIKVSDAPTVTIGGNSYREFLLDVNQLTCNPSNFISLDGLEIYTANSATLTGYPNLGTKVYSLDTATVDNSIKLDSLLAGTGNVGDMLFYLPTSLVTNPSNYLYLYSQFGVVNPANDGYEQWMTRSGNGVLVPEPMTWVLMIMGLGFVVILKAYRPTAANQA